MPWEFRSDQYYKDHIPNLKNESSDLLLTRHGQIMRRFMGTKDYSKYGYHIIIEELRGQNFKSIRFPDPLYQMQSNFDDLSSDQKQQSILVAFI